MNTGQIFRALQKRIDHVSRYLIPALTVIIVIFSELPTFDISDLKSTHPYVAAMLETFSSNSFIVIFMSAMIQGILLLINELNRRTIKQLELELTSEKNKNEVIANNIKALFDGFLFHLSVGKLAFSDREARVTLYIHDGEQMFIPFGRYSTNPLFSQPGRSEYPDNQGAISHGWQKGWYFDSTNKNDYVAHNSKKYEMPTEVLKKVKMQSKLFAVKRIDNHNGQPIALILVESTNATQFTEDDIKDILTKEERVIGELIVQLKEYIPLPFNAKSKGL